MIGRLLANRFGAVLIGAVLLAIGLSMDSSTVTCGGVQMQPGDQCSSTSRRGGDTVVRSYDEQRAADGRVGKIMLAGGSVLVLGGLTMIVVRIVRRRDTATAPTATEPTGAH